MEILKYPHPLLRKETARVIEFNEELKIQAKAMLEAMRKNRGIGLSANQVGINKRIIVMECRGKQPYILINPEIVERSSEYSTQYEGCLSFPGIFAKLRRPNWAKVVWQDVKGQEYEQTFEGIEATCIQHEIDHLNGIVFVQKLQHTKKFMLLNEYAKSHKIPRTKLRCI